MEDEPFSIKTSTRTHLHAVLYCSELAVEDSWNPVHIAQKISRSYFITVHVDEITVLFLLEKNKTGNPSI